MPDFIINESNQGEYSVYWIECLEQFDTIKDAKEYLKNMKVTPSRYEVKRDT
jgi:hypothetical protein